MPFAGYDHVDARVRSLAAVRDFYDRLMPSLGLTKIIGGGDDYSKTVREWYEPEQSGPSRRFFGIHEDAAHVPGLSRLAFTAHSREDVDRAAAAAVSAGARNVEGPEDAYEHEPYYAVFFEDPEGNKLEVCYRPGGDAFP